MRLLFFSNVLPSSVHPGRGTFNRTMLEALSVSNHVRAVVPISWLDRLRQRGKRESDELTWFYPPKVFRASYGNWMWRSVRGRLSEIASEVRPDLVLSYWMHPDGEVAGRLAEQIGCPHVAMTGGSDVLMLARSGRRRERILSVAKNAATIVTIGEHLRSQLIEDGIAETKIYPIYRGIDSEVFHPSTCRTEAPTTLPPLVLAVGRLVGLKRHVDLIQAADRLKQDGFPIRMVIAGDGPLRESLQETIDRGGLRDTVQLIGARHQRSLAGLYRQATVTALTSESEGIPNVLLEAIACGSRVVSTPVGGVPEIVDPVHDRLVPVGDVPALAEAIRSVCETPQPSSQRCFQPRSLIEANHEFEKILRKVLNQHADKSPQAIEVLA